MSSRSRDPLGDWDDDWIPPRWDAADDSGHYRKGAARRTADPWHDERQTFIPRPEDDPRQLLLLAIAPAVTCLLAALMWLLSPLPGAGPSPAPLFLVAAVQVCVIVLARDSAPTAFMLPWSTLLAATVGLLPLLAIQVSLFREPYVSLSSGTAWPAVIATVVASVVAIAIAISVSVRSWKQPDQAALTFLPVALLIPGAIGQRSEVDIRNALSVLAIATLLATIATLCSGLLPLGMRLVVPPVALGLEIVLLWAVDRGPVFHPTSGGIIRVLYLLMLFLDIVLVVGVPIVSVWIRKSSSALNLRSGRPV